MQQNGLAWMVVERHYDDEQPHEYGVYRGTLDDDPHDSDEVDSTRRCHSFRVAGSSRCLKGEFVLSIYLVSDEACRQNVLGEV